MSQTLRDQLLDKEWSPDFVQALIDDVVALREALKYFEGNRFGTRLADNTLQASDARLKSLGIEVGE